MFGHFDEMPAFLLVELVVDNASRRSHEHDDNDKIKSMHAIGVCNLPIDIKPESHQRQHQKITARVKVFLFIGADV